MCVRYLRRLKHTTRYNNIRHREEHCKKLNENTELINQDYGLQTSDTHMFGILIINAIGIINSQLHSQHEIRGYFEIDELLIFIVLFSVPYTFKCFQYETKF